jgi:dGTPase
MNLASYACHPNKSQGRIYDEPSSEYRNDFQRDRDRIIHSSSFRRLQYKTQVFVNHEGDMFRSRLTHSLEVSQIARGISRSLQCHEELSEAIALAHDLGHTPFGHAGQDALHECMHDYGGFEHNLQSLRVVDFLEQRYINFSGLNLTFEVREGILKHCSKKNALLLGNVGKRFINNLRPSLEAQIVNYADEIAYLHHDLDDGFRSGILNFPLLDEIELFKQVRVELQDQYQKAPKDKLLNEIIRRMMAIIIDDLCKESSKHINVHNPKDTNDVRKLPQLIVFSKQMIRNISQIKQFSRVYIYNHKKIKKMTNDAERIIKDLFNYFLMNFNQIPEFSTNQRKEIRERIIADYISGMTDRYAIQKYNSLKRKF